MRVRVQKFFLLASVSCVFFYLAGCVPITPPITKTSASSTRDSAYQPFVFPFDLPNSYEGKTFSSRLLIAIPTPGVIRDATAKFYGTNYHDHLKNVEKIHKRLMTRAEAIKNSGLFKSVTIEVSSSPFSAPVNSYDFKIFPHAYRSGEWAWYLSPDLSSEPQRISSISRAPIVGDDPDLYDRIASVLISSHEEQPDIEPEQKDQWVAKSSPDGNLYELKPVKSGTGFFVSKEGHILTNHHVVDGCGRVDVFFQAKQYSETVLIGSDENVDLAVIKVDIQPIHVAKFRARGSAKSGTEVMAVGFPLQTILGDQVKVTRGMINSTVGLNSNINEMQISAQIQSGNSGGPLIDDTGRVVGVVVAKLDEIRLARSTGSFAQNINFAIKGPTAKTALEAFGINYEASNATKVLRTEEIADRASKYTVLLKCMN